MDRKRTDVQHGTRWGPWTYDAERLVLTHKNNKYPGSWYEPDLERCRSSAEVLDWIFQIAEKDWGVPETLGYFVLAIKDLLDPQDTLCSWGVDVTTVQPRGLDVKQFLKDGKKQCGWVKDIPGSKAASR